MAEIITIEQQEEIAELAREGHYDALVAYGADMHRQGIWKGGAAVIAVLLVAFAGTVVVEIVKNCKVFKQK